MMSNGLLDRFLGVVGLMMDFVFTAICFIMA